MGAVADDDVGLVVGRLVGRRLGFLDAGFADVGFIELSLDVVAFIDVGFDDDGFMEVGLDVNGIFATLAEDVESMISVSGFGDGGVDGDGVGDGSIDLGGLVDECPFVDGAHVGFIDGV